VATPIFPCLAWQPWVVFLCPAPDSHVPEQVLCALHQDDAIKWGVLTHHATRAIAAHHELQREEEGELILESAFQTSPWAPGCHPPTPLRASLPQGTLFSEKKAAGDFSGLII
jgi:hypothetical protein